MDEDKQYSDDDLTEQDELDARGMRVDDEEREGSVLDPDEPEEDEGAL